MKMTDCKVDYENMEKGLEITELAVGRAKKTPGYVTTDARPGWSHGYLARLYLPRQESLSLERDFVEPTQSDLSRAGNGSKSYRISDLGDGTYEADSVARSYQSTRKYFEVRSGRIDRIYETIDQVEKEAFNDLGGRRAAKNEQLTEQLAQKAAEAGLPKLKGSTKQIAWAMKIRDTAITSLDRIRQNPPGIMLDMAEDARAAIFVAYRSHLLKEADASKWIDRRDRDLSFEFRAFAIEFLQKNPVV